MRLPHDFARCRAERMDLGKAKRPKESHSAVPDKREEEEIFLCQELATGKHIERILSVYVYHAS